MSSTSISQLPKKTFLQKAREDLAECKREVSGEFRWCKTSRRAMVNLLNKAILEADQKGYDDKLFITYHNIDVMMRGWYFEDALKLIISTTLLEIQRNIIARQESVTAKLSEEKQILRESLVSVREAHGLLQQVLTEKTNMLRIANEDNATLRKIKNQLQKENTQLKQDLATEKRVSARLRRELELEKAKFSSETSSSETSSEPDCSTTSSTESSYNPRLFGGSSFS